MVYAISSATSAYGISAYQSGSTQVSKEVQDALDSISIFEEQKSLTRTQLHYIDMCASLSNEDDSSLIKYLTGTIKDGIEGISGQTVKDANQDSWQNTIKSLTNNFTVALSSAKDNVKALVQKTKEEQATTKAESTQETSGAKEATKVEQPEAADVENIFETTQLLDSTIAEVQSSSLTSLTDKSDSTAATTTATDTATTDSTTATTTAAATSTTNTAAATTDTAATAATTAAATEATNTATTNATDTAINPAAATAVATATTTTDTKTADETKTEVPETAAA